MEKDNSLISKIFSKSWMPFFIIIAGGFLLYGRTLFFNFTYLDDNNLILNNQYFLANLANIFQSFLTDVFLFFNHSAFYYRPLLTISLMFDYQIGGISPFIYHFTNVLLHIASSYLVFIFLTKLNYRKNVSFFFSFIFLVHPVLTQAVAWIPGRNDSLLAIFILSTSIFFIKYLDGRKIGNLIWSLLFFASALFTKESAMLILPILLFYLYFFYKKENKLSFDKFYSPSPNTPQLAAGMKAGRILRSLGEAGLKASENSADTSRLRREELHFFIASIGIVSLWAVLRHLALKGFAAITLTDAAQSVYFNFPAVAQFLGKIFFPLNLSVLPIMRDTTFWYGIISIVLLAMALFFTQTKRWNFILFGAGWFFAFLLPSFIRPNPALVADFIEHRLYVPIIGVFMILLETDWVKKIDFRKKSALVISGSLILLFSAITTIHSANFADRLSFWKNAARNSPHYPLAHRNLGAMEYLDGNMGEAEKEFKMALELNPNEPMAHNNLGLVYANKSKFKEAEDEYKKELEINPYYDDAYFNLGLLYWGQKKYEEALSNWKKTLEVNPNYVDASRALEIACLEKSISSSSRCKP